MLSMFNVTLSRVVDVVLERRNNIAGGMQSSYGAKVKREPVTIAEMLVHAMNSSLQDLYDSLGRPAIFPSHHSERGSGRWQEPEVEKQDTIQRVASYVKNSNMALVRLPVHVCVQYVCM